VCDLSYGDIEPCDLWREATPTARKAHRCDCCRGSIAPGERYKRIFMVSDGHPSTERECLPCGEMMVKFKAHHGDWYSPSGMRELLDECFADESAYDDQDELVPTSDLGRMWAAELAAMDARADARRAGGAA